MRLLCTDLETTGFDTQNDHITEVGCVLWETDNNSVLKVYSSFLYDNYPPLTPVIQKVTGITDAMLKEFGRPPAHVFHDLNEICTKYGVKYLVAHNGNNFDIPFLRHTLTKYGCTYESLFTLPVIDTREDLPFVDPPDSMKLKHLACDMGIINPFPHRALFDALTMCRVLSAHPIEKVIEQSKIPSVILRAMVSYEDRQLAKDAKFSWEKIGDLTFPKCWVKKVKVIEEYPFKVVKL